MIPILLALNMSFLFVSSKLIAVLPMEIEPELGLSINDNRFNKVDFPEPEGPIKE